ncbi:cell division topological specificity factor [Thermostichus sp. MS-CIW-21]|jgi:cell division topological specificity factor|uniref:Cell division topological specificity factor n=1 Tax=Synechococcus sp. (strain JA-3-3Ab) TaxID=321327 RepID=MINE_SYNJA|nr:MULTISPECIES: cell division topological specificity factor MinE [unclassified Synechococcus]Q2JV04.1 RecName: Full=Cell division topological specificity factor [Synechococcus sp. JA-3-3Ab]ABC99448.1 cell division topological specificity factor MinE [Synechococcus sp. JA-3-3Ab]PIK85232.1 cell division topological specificity factor [Synechococcus sp. 63AY4M2]PIK88485.1 cell division topological specificity factor [Synechococcus sp. 65AY6A5]PIK92916.1 cell division topological specificity fac
MLLDFLDQLFSRHSGNSREQAKQRLKLILAHDRADLTPAALEAMRLEILGVVSRYVELDSEGMQFHLAAEGGTTALIANLPIRRVKPLAEARLNSCEGENPQQDPGAAPSEGGHLSSPSP